MNQQKLSDLLQELEDKFPDDPKVKEAKSIADQLYGDEKAEMDDESDDLDLLGEPKDEAPADDKKGPPGIDDLLADDSESDDMGDIFGKAEPADKKAPPFPPKKKKKPGEEEEDESVVPPGKVNGSY